MAAHSAPSPLLVVMLAHSAQRCVGTAKLFGTLFSQRVPTHYDACVILAVVARVRLAAAGARDPVTKRLAVFEGELEEATPEKQVQLLRL